jgi:hypothetical protein
MSQVSYKRPVRFAEGETLIACSSCGFPYLFPSELTYTDERTFVCNRTCLDDETVTTHNKRLANAHKRKPDNEVPRLTGGKPSWR